VTFRFPRRLLAASLSVLLVLGLSSARAEDIDIFMHNSAGGSTVLPNIMFMVDNSANWSRAAQQWPDNGGIQGAAEMAAFANVLGGNVRANVGLAGFTGSGTSVGGYIRFGARDMTVAANKTALVGIANHIKANVEAADEKVNSNNETAGMYEVYKYFKGMSVFRGGKVTGNDPARYVDLSGNSSGGSTKRTATDWGLTTGHALVGTTYQIPGGDASCGRDYLIMVINNAQGALPPGARTYETTDALEGGQSALPTLPGGDSWTDEWARFLYQKGITVYILDAYNKQQNAAYSAVLARAALVGGGKYYAVKSQSQIEAAFKEILAEIQSVNSNFAAAALPISATNRSQNLNQVFIGMFRPDGQAEPRWRGNLKQYQLTRDTAGVLLSDSQSPPVNAINTQTGFVADCSVSFWTTDSASYWQNAYDNLLATSSCTAFPTVGSVTGSKWSDMPDGPSVEKGGVAQVIRKGNNPPTTNTTPTYTVNRSLLTFSASETSKLAPLTTTNTGWSAALYDWVRGFDDKTASTVDGVTSYPRSEFTDNTSSTPARTRPSIHGDVIHSRPLPVNYGGSTGVTVYYGANDGMLRAVDSSNGRERWAYVAPEHYSRFQRLADNRPLINYPNVDASLTPTPRSKDYFFDGSIALFQNADNSKIWIFPTQRRGGRMLYGFDVTNPAAPAIMWRVGCPNLHNDTDCTAGFSGLGQSWSLPAVGFLKGYSSTTPVLIVGGGYDSCEDANTGTPGCGSRKGAGVYVIDANTGALVRHFATGGGSIAADISLSDVNGDGSIDVAYAASTTGEVFRIDFSGTAYAPAASTAWAMRKIAFTTGGSRKFLFPPALLRSSTKMYVAVGSGDREHPLSTHYPVTTPVTNRFYVYLDDLTVPATSTAAATNLDSDAGMQNYSTASSQTCGVTGVTPTSGLKGWYMDLPGTGEQTISSALIASGMVTFNTNRAMTSAGSVCVNPLGEARGYWVNLLNASGAIGVGNATCGGDRSSAFIGGGLAPSPTLATVIIGGKATTVAIGAAQRSGGASSTIAPQQVRPAIDSRRRPLYWKSSTAD
jgi:type IV pilus assembly protein PilY1